MIWLKNYKNNIYTTFSLAATSLCFNRSNKWVITLGQVILARKRQSSCTTRAKSALTILRTASTWTRPTRH